LPQTQLITFKQVRDTDFSSASAHTIVNNACFQAIIGSTMTIDRVGDFGLLYDLTSGDTSGGIEISLLQSAEAPILNTLGLITASTTGVGETLGPLFVPSPILDENGPGLWHRRLPGMADYCQ